MLKKIKTTFLSAILACTIVFSIKIWSRNMFDMLNKTQNSVYATTFSSTNFWLKMAVFAVYNNINTNLVVYMIFILRKNGMYVTRDIN